jgi:hypothetical protein
MMPASMTTTIAGAPVVGAEHKAAIGWQPDLFYGPDPLVGIEVNLPSHCRCGNDTLHIGPGCGPHRVPLCIALVAGVTAAGFQTRVRNSSAA